MKLDEAIDLLTEIPPWPNENDDPCYLDALNLGIEALKRITYQRNYHLSRYSDLLPGETKE